MEERGGGAGDLVVHTLWAPPTPRRLARPFPVVAVKGTVVGSSWAGHGSTGNGSSPSWALVFGLPLFFFGAIRLSELHSDIASSSKHFFFLFPGDSAIGISALRFDARLPAILVVVRWSQRHIT